MTLSNSSILLPYFVTLILFLIILVTILLITHLYSNPNVLLRVYNSLLEPWIESPIFYSKEQKEMIFPASLSFEKNWKQIRREGMAILPMITENVGRNFQNFDDEFWDGWTTFPLRMFGQDLEVNMDRCPTLKRLLKENPEIPTAFLSVMKAGKRLSEHRGPFKGIIRYHLGLKIPRNGECFISVGGIPYFWKEGEGVLFDETYPHYVVNSTSSDRLILFLDIKRPLTGFLRDLNDLFLDIIRKSPHIQRALRKFEFGI